MSDERELNEELDGSEEEVEAHARKPWGPSEDPERMIGHTADGDEDEVEAHKMDSH